MGADNRDPGKSNKKLPDKEKRDRRRCNGILLRLSIPSGPMWSDKDTVKDFVNSRALPCALTLEGVSERYTTSTSYKRYRTFPNKISVWKDHLDSIKSLEEIIETFLDPPSDPYIACLSKRREQRKSEASEKGYVISTVLEPLFGSRLEEDDGRVDATIKGKEGDTVLICIEFKSTHNLPLLRSAEEIVEVYNISKENATSEDDNSGGENDRDAGNDGSGAGSSSSDPHGGRNGSNGKRRKRDHDKNKNKKTRRELRECDYDYGAREDLKWEKSIKHNPAIFEDEDWKVVYAFGQLVELMRVNNCMFGVLTSGTRTYFVRVKLNEGKFDLEISRR